jgi:DDE superfamily endonuclease
VFDDADEFHGRWLPTLRALWSPRGQQVLMPTPGQPYKRYGLGAVNDQPGETVVRFRRRKRRREVAELLQALVDKHPAGTIEVAWEHADSHADAEVEAVVRAAAGRLGLLYGPTYRPWLTPIARLWRPCRRDVPHGARLASLDGLLKAAPACVDRSNQGAERVLSSSGAQAASPSWLHLVVYH